MSVLGPATWNVGLLVAGLLNAVVMFCVISCNGFFHTRKSTHLFGISRSATTLLWWVKVERRVCLRAGRGDDEATGSSRRTSFAHQRSYSCGDISPTETDRDEDRDGDAGGGGGDGDRLYVTTAAAAGIVVDVDRDENRRRRHGTNREVRVADDVGVKGKLSSITKPTTLLTCLPRW